MTTNHEEYYRGLERAGRALAETTDLAPSERAAAVHDAVTPLLADTEAHHELACRSGCAHCCHFPVGVTFAEASRLADALRECANSPTTARLLAEAEATQQLSWSQLVGRPCPLLAEGTCQVYDARPLPCRALASRDAAACAAALLGGPPPPRDEAAWWRGVGAAAALASTAPPGTRELRAAVAALLGTASEQAATAFLASRRVPSD